jgi:hypothetical protein
MLPLLWGTEIIAGILLLAGVLVPLALVLLAPVIVNIAAFHVFLAPGAIQPAIVVSALELFLGWKYRSAFGPLFGAGYPHPHPLAGHREGTDGNRQAA